MKKMDFITLHEKLIWDTLENGKNLLELTTYRNVSLWWNVDNRCFSYIFHLLNRKKHLRGRLKHILILRLLEKSLGIYLLFLFDLILFLISKFILLISKPIRSQPSFSHINKPLIIVSTPLISWRTYRDYIRGVCKKTDTLKEPIMRLLHNEACFLGVRQLVYTKVSLKRYIAVLLRWDYPFRTFETFWSPKSWFEQKKAFNHFKKLWHIIDHDTKLITNCQVENTNFSTPFLNELKYYFHYLIPKTVSYIETCRNMITKTNPSLFFLSNEYSSWERNLIIAAKQEKLPVFALQHGIIHPTHRGYMYSSRDIDTTGSILSPYCPVPDKTAVYGEKFKNLLISGGFPPTLIEMTGQPRFDIFFSLKSFFKNKNRLRDILKLPKDKYLLIWTTETHGLPLDENIKNIDAVYNAVSNLPEVELIIKLHPGENQVAPLYRKYNSKVRIFEGGADTPLLILASDILLTKDSTTGLEAVLLDRPVIILNLSNKTDLVDYVREGVAVGVYKKENLRDVITSLIRDDPLISARKTYITQYYMTDGKSSKRAAEALRSMISKTSS